MTNSRFTQSDLQHRDIVPPSEGWTSNTRYPVEVAIGHGSLIIRGILHVHELNEHGVPAKMSYVDCNPGVDERHHWENSQYLFKKIHYLRVMDIRG